MWRTCREQAEGSRSAQEEPGPRSQQCVLSPTLMMGRKTEGEAGPEPSVLKGGQGRREWGAWARAKHRRRRGRSLHCRRGWDLTKSLISPVLEVGSLRPRCGQGWVLPRSLLAFADGRCLHRGPPSACLNPAGLSVSKFPLLLRSPV